MDRVTGERLLQLVDSASRHLNAVNLSASAVSEKSLALFRLHSAAVLSAAVSYIVVPVSRDNRELERSMVGESIAEFRMSSEAKKAAADAFARVKSAMEDARSVVQGAALPAAERDSYLTGIQKVLAYVDESIDVISRQ